MSNTYWRIQDAGYALSQSHRSATFSEDESDEGETHAGSSAVRTIRDLPRAQANLHMGDVEIVKFEGKEVGTGWDGEPVVIPTREVLRFRRQGGVGSLASVTSIRDLLDRGWVDAPRQSVAS